MQKIDDLKEIFTATHDLGVAWQNELVALRAENSRLADENKNLADNYDKLFSSYEKLSAENKNLRGELNNLSEQIGQLIANLRGDILTELNEKNPEDFQKFVKDYLMQIRKCVDGAVVAEKSQGNFPSHDDDERPNYGD